MYMKYSTAQYYLQKNQVSVACAIGDDPLEYIAIPAPRSFREALNYDSMTRDSALTNGIYLAHPEAQWSSIV